MSPLFAFWLSIGYWQTIRYFPTSCTQIATTVPFPGWLLVTLITDGRFSNQPDSATSANLMLWLSAFSSVFEGKRLGAKLLKWFERASSLFFGELETLYQMQSKSVKRQIVLSQPLVQHFVMLATQRDNIP